jgi:hypothetical protein
MTYKKAEQLAAAWVEICFDGKAALMLQHTITKPYGWVFFYQSRSFLETQDERQMLLGNAPIIVDRVNGEVVVTGTAKPVEKYLEEYEAKIPPARLKMTPQPPAT